MIRRRRGGGPALLPDARRTPAGRGREANADHGMVTLEVALALPLIVIFVVAGAVLLAAGATQARLTDAVRTTARELARGDAPADALAAGRRIAPDAQVVIRSSGPVIEVAARQEVHGPGPLLGALSQTITATAVTAAEQPR